MMCSKPVHRYWLSFYKSFLKIVPALRVNETKAISRNTIINNLFPLKSEKESKMDSLLRLLTDSWSCC